MVRQRHHVDALEDYAQHPPDRHPGEYSSLAVTVQRLISSRTISTRWRYARIPRSHHSSQAELTETLADIEHRYAWINMCGLQGMR